jgi:thiol-disulfide isomerase/thioredoxin
LRLASVDRSLSDLGHAEDAAQKAVEAAHGRPGLLAAAEEALGDLLSARAGSEHPKQHLLQQAVQAFRSGLAAAPAGALHNQLQFKLGVVLLRARKDAEAKALLTALPATPGVDAAVAKQARAIAADPHLAFEEMPPEFSVSASDGHVYSNENLRGKVVLLDFWGSWCLPCRDSEPMMVSIYKTFAQQPGFRMLGIDVGDTPRNMEEFVASHHMRWPQIQDRTWGLTREFGAGVVPMYILIRRDGSAELVTEGLDFVEAGRISGETQYALEQAIRQALKQPAPVPQ